MNRNLDNILTGIAEEFRSNISENSRYYLEVDIGKHAGKMGYSDEEMKYGKVNAVVPLKEPVKGMKVMIDGRTFTDYAQFGSGIAVPGYVARDSELPCKAYEADESMILNFA